MKKKSRKFSLTTTPRFLVYVICLPRSYFDLGSTLSLKWNPWPWASLALCTSVYSDIPISFGNASQMLICL